LPAQESVIDYERLIRPPAFWDNCLFWLFHSFLRLTFRILFRFRVEGSPPAKGGYVIAANHASYLDPLILGASIRRRLAYLMTETVWRSPSAGWFYRWNRAIPLSARGGNRDALRAARGILKQSRALAIFPEGGLSRDGLLMLGSPGAVSLVLNEGLPIVPVGIIGANEALSPGSGRPRLCRIIVRYGTPIMPDEIAALGEDRRTRLRDATRMIMQRIAELTDQESREDVLAAAHDA
jgi:1-acyl-sn-glycerol-3-phosphate acyltransferase